MTENENPKKEVEYVKEQMTTLKCERCNTDNSARIYDPRIARLPDKRIALCDECAGKDATAILAEDAVPETSSEPAETQETIMTPKSKVPKASQNKAKDVETKPIDRVDIQKKITMQEKNIDTLLKKRQEIQQQLIQVQDMIKAKIGAVAGLRDLLGNDS